MRSYELVPGTLLEWETAWKRGLEARKRFVVSLFFWERSWIVHTDGCRSG